MQMKFIYERLFNLLGYCEYGNSYGRKANSFN